MNAPAPVDYHDTCHHRIYRLSCDDLDELLEHAGRCCQICRRPEVECKRGRLVIDHAGEYGFRAVRGLLCDKCNALMRHVDSGAVIDARAYDYRYNAWFVRVVAARHPRGVALLRRDVAEAS